MSKNHLHTKIIGLKAALTFIGEHYVPGWNGQELAANALPAPDALKKHLAALKQQNSQAYQQLLQQMAQEEQKTQQQGMLGSQGIVNSPQGANLPTPKPLAA